MWDKLFCFKISRKWLEGNIRFQNCSPNPRHSWNEVSSWHCTSKEDWAIEGQFFYLVTYFCVIYESLICLFLVHVYISVRVRVVVVEKCHLEDVIDKKLWFFLSNKWWWWRICENYKNLYWFQTIKQMLQISFNLFSGIIQHYPFNIQQMIYP